MSCDCGDTDKLLIANRGIRALDLAISNNCPVPIGGIEILNSNQEVQWELIVRDTSRVTDYEIQIVIAQSSTETSRTISLSRGSAISYSGFGAVRVFATPNVLAGNVFVSLGPQGHHPRRYRTMGNPTWQSVAAPIGNFVPVDSGGDGVNGYAPPFCDRLTILPAFAGAGSSIRFVDSAGVVIVQRTGLLNTDPFWNEIIVIPFFQIQIAGALGAGPWAFGIMWWQS